MSAGGQIGGWQKLVIVSAMVAVGAPAVAAGLAPVAAQAGGGGQEIATLWAMRGHVSVIRLGRTSPATSSMPLQLDDIVVTKSGRATVRFHSDGAVVRIGPDSRVQINESATERDVTLFFGRLWAHVVRWKERTTRFRTSSTIAAIRGTELSVGLEADGDETRVAVLEGTVETSNDSGSLTVSGGQSAISKKGNRPVRDIRVTPTNAVQWALYYLPVLSPKTGTLGQGQPWQASVDQSVTAWDKGDLAGALDALEGVSDQGIQDARFFTYRASLLLAAGQVDDANQDIDRALKVSANDSDALALQAIIAVAQNDVDKANSAAQRAVSQAPSSSTARIALSYAQQARFDLEGARASLEKAVELAPNDALAWARLAEIHSSLGHLGDSLEAAQKAVSLQPNLSRTQTVLGFAYLTRVQIAEAKEAFNKAIGFDADDPLPRLGLGLAQIRDGDLAGGNEELEVAVSLDPADSIVRSYLGKGYYEAKRGPLDEREYGVAEQADPLDPTPRFYQAIAEQTTNRPVDGLESLQKAVELNDNRAVYRSRLLLDQDLASRSAALARIYTDLGFQDRALVEGWTAVNTDPSNFSAHRFLADSYAVLPRHEIARVSELFQSQMLQPLNTTPIQPRLGESNLFLISAQGPASLSFYEFNPLFNRDQVNLQGSFLYAGSSCGIEESLGFCPAEPDDTLAGEGIVSGIYKKVSFSAGYSGFDSDGFRENGNQKDQIANAFVQAEVSPNTSIQGEVRYRKVESGDLGLRFFENDFSPFQEETTDGTNVRVGLRQDFGPSVKVLASYMHADGTIDFTLPDPFAGVNFDIDRDEKSDSVEGQILYASSKLKFVGGAGYFDIDSNEANVFALDDPIFGFTETTTTDARTTHTNLYGYGYISPVQTLTVTVGLSGDLFDETGEATSEFEIPGLPPDAALPIEAAVLGSRDQANPKGGVSWTPGMGTTLRAAAFRTLKRTLITDQTLEPTQVAGFNQFFDDPTGTEAWVYGGAIDQKLGHRAFAGVQYTRRDLTIPQTLIDFDPVTGGRAVSVEDRDGTEDLARVYLFAAPHPWFSLGLEYGYEQLELDELLFLGFSNVKTQTVPLTVRFFHPSGLSAYLGATYLDQKGDFLTFNEVGEQVYVPGSKDFWVVDLAVRYRLPKRYGILAFGVNNLTDERSTYYATDPENLRIRPGRVVYASVVLAVP